MIHDIYQRFPVNDTVVALWHEKLEKFDIALCRKAFFDYAGEASGVSGAPSVADIRKLAQRHWKDKPKVEMKPCEICHSTGVVSVLKEKNVGTKALEYEEIYRCSCQNGDNFEDLPVFTFSEWQEDKNRKKIILI